MIRKNVLKSIAMAMTLGGVSLSAPLVQAATNVVTCDPTDGLTSSVAVNPAMVNNASPDAKIGLALKTQWDGCVANAAQLAAWVPSKNGTDNGALIQMADIQLKAKGFGTCNFAAPTPAAYAASGTIKVKWLDGAGKTVGGVKPSSVAVRVSGDLATVSAKATGIVTKGLGIGADFSILAGFDLANPVNGPVLACNTGPYAGPPVEEIALITAANSVLSIDFP